MLLAILQLKSKRKPSGRPLCALSTGRLWILLDTDEESLDDLEWVALTDQPENPSSYDSRNATVVARVGRLCAVRFDGEPFTKHALPLALTRHHTKTSKNALDLISAISHSPEQFDTLAHVVTRLDPEVQDGDSEERLTTLFSGYVLADHFDRVTNPTRLVFERRDALVTEMERHLRRSPLTILVGGVSAGRTPLTAVLKTANDGLRYIADGDVSPDLMQIATEVGDLYVKSYTRHPSGLATLLTALMLAAIRQLGADSGRRAFPDAHASEAEQPMRAFASHVLRELRATAAAAGPAEMIGLFLKLLERLVVSAKGIDSITVLLPFEKLEAEWRQTQYPALWTGLKNLAYDLSKLDDDHDGHVRLLVMARSVPFDALGDAGVRALLLAMPPLSEFEIQTRLLEFAGARVSDATVQAVRRTTGGIPVLTAALLHAMPKRTFGVALDVPEIEAAINKLKSEIPLVCADQPTQTESGRILLEFVREMRKELAAGDEAHYSVFSGGLLFLDDHLTHESFHRLFRAGLLWFEPTLDSIWSSLREGTFFQMTPSAPLVDDILRAVAAQPGKAMVSQ